jgi:hypothetical protein
MQRHPFLAALLLAVRAAADGSAAAVQVTPVQKVIHMLEGMLSKGKEEKHQEQVQFAAYKQFCDDTTAEKRRLVKEAEEAIVMMKAEIQKTTSDSQELGRQVAQLDADIATWTGDLKAISKVRQIEKADYDAMHKDYSESVDALQRAIAVLKQQAFDRRQPSSLAQVKALKDLTLIPPEAKKAIDNFLQDTQEPEDDGLAVSAPEANGYEFQSHGVVDMLERLLDKFVDMRTALEKEEMNSRHSFDLLSQDLNSQISQANTDRGEKATTKAKALQTKADVEGDLQETSSTKAADEKYLSDLSGTCGQKEADYESRQQLRAEELEALAKACEILSSGAVAGNADKYLPSFAQARSLAQLRSRSISPAQAHAAQFLRDKAESLNSRVLSALATHAADDPMGKVKKLIKDLIVRLMNEANEEAQHKGWCDTELSTNEQTRKEKSEAVEALHAEIDELSASLSQLQDDISELSKSVADLDSDMAKATELRQEQKQTNLMTIKDSQDAQAAVAQALVVLKEFYAKSAESTALMQKKGTKLGKQEPEIFSGAYKGMQAENGGVIGMLEVIQSDFARLEAETSAEESTTQKEYDEFMTDSKVDKASKQKDIEYKTAKRQDQTQAVTMKSNDLEGTQKELDAALAYYDKLKPSCVDSGSSYEDRVVRRKEEIESLQEALKILNGEDIA